MIVLTQFSTRSGGISVATAYLRLASSHSHLGLTPKIISALGVYCLDCLELD